MGWLNELPSDTIRRRYKGQHLYLHAGDWLRYWAGQDERAFQGIGAEEFEGYIADTKAREAELRTKMRQRE